MNSAVDQVRYSRTAERLTRWVLLATDLVHLYAPQSGEPRYSREGDEVRTNLDILAVTSKDLRALLTEWHLDKLVDSGELRCPDTGDRITWNNIGTVRVEGGKPVLYSIDANSTQQER